MTLPGIEIAVIEERKVVGYLLAADHPEGASKAAFFEAHGFRRGDWQVLADALRTTLAVTWWRAFPVALRNETRSWTAHRRSPDGRMPMVRAIWIVDAGTEFPRLVTAYPMDV